jgi:nucleotidyltransferase substrate binding protein (TIGR01987 family)
MRERTKKYLSDFEKAISNIKIILDKEEQDDISTDAGIKRFELCYELAWKLIKTYLEDLGIICKNPRSCFKAAFSNDLIDDDKVWMDMIHDRNLLVHTYTMEQSREIFDHIKDKYFDSLKYLWDRIKEEKEREEEVEDE